MGGGGARVMSSSNYERATTGVEKKKRKMNIATVIPCPRKSVKRIIFESALHFIARFVCFRPKAS